MGTRVKRPGRAVNHLPPSNAQVKNEWIYISSVEVLRKKIKSIQNVYRQELTKIERLKKKVEQKLTMFMNLNLHGLRGLIFS